MQDSDSDRLVRLEKKVDWLNRLVAIQIVVVCLFGLRYGISYLFQLAGTIVVLLIIAMPLLYLFRDSLPAGVRGAGKRVGKLFATLIGRWNVSS